MPTLDYVLNDNETPPPANETVTLDMLGNVLTRDVIDEAARTISEGVTIPNSMLVGTAVHEQLNAYARWSRPLDIPDWADQMRNIGSELPSFADRYAQIRPEPESRRLTRSEERLTRRATTSRFNSDGSVRFTPPEANLWWGPEERRWVSDISYGRRDIPKWCKSSYEKEQWCKLNAPN